MKYRLFGKTGVKVSELCLGTMTFGRYTSKDDSFAVMDRFSEQGGNFLDTANIYNSGASEEILGQWLKGQQRDEYFIATKVRFPTGNGPNSSGLTRKHILQSVKESLKRLGTDYIDLLQVHAWDPLTPVSQTMRALNSLVESGLVRYIGASNFRAWQLALSLNDSRMGGLEEFSSLQPQYNLLTRATEYELIPLCSAEDIAVLPWSPLKGGLLSGKYLKGKKPENDETRIWENVRKGGAAPWEQNEDYVWSVVNAVRKVAEETGKTPSQVALNWLLSKKGVTSPIIGARNLSQLEENLGSAGWKLSREHMDILDEASNLFVSYPYDEESEEQQNYGRKN